MNIKQKIGFLYKKLSINQSGQKNLWILDFSQNNEQYIEPIMNFTGSLNSNSQIRMTFSKKDDAINFAKKNNYFIKEIFVQHESENLSQKKIKPKNYARNFDSA
jgi:hypothetical protein